MGEEKVRTVVSCKVRKFLPPTPQIWIRTSRKLRKEEKGRVSYKVLRSMGSREVFFNKILNRPTEM
jgi:hypothetical protein